MLFSKGSTGAALLELAPSFFSSSGPSSGTGLKNDPVGLSADMVVERCFLLLGGLIILGLGEKAFKDPIRRIETNAVATIVYLF